MKPYRWNHMTDNENEGQPDSTEADGHLSDDLEIEKKWLKQAKIDIEKFEFLYRKYRPKIYRYICLNILEEDLASNLTDETFSRAVDKLDSFKWQGYSFGAWLFQIARNVMRQEFRRRNTKPEVAFDPAVHDAESGSRPDLDTHRVDESRLLTHCLGELRPDRREVIINHYGLGLTTREIGIVMEMNESTVKSHLVRGRKQLLKCLVACGMDRGLAQGTQRIFRETAAREQGWDVLGAKEEEPTEGNDG